MRCPKCSAWVTRDDKISRMSWGAFSCPQCEAQLEASTLSHVLVFLGAALVWLGIDVTLWALGAGGLVNMGVGAVSFFAAAYFGLGSLSWLKVSEGSHPSLSQ